MEIKLARCHRGFCTCSVLNGLCDQGFSYEEAWAVARFLETLDRELEQRLGALQPEPLGQAIVEELLGSLLVRELGGERPAEAIERVVVYERWAGS